MAILAVPDQKFGQRQALARGAQTRALKPFKPAFRGMDGGGISDVTVHPSCIH